LKLDFQERMFDFLYSKGIKNFVGVPDSTLKKFISRGITKDHVLIATREEEAIGIAVGMLLCKKPALVFMQNAGFANSLSTITSLVQLYKFPLIFLIGWRGYKKEDAPEHTKIGKIQPRLLKDIGLESRILKVNNWRECCEWAIKRRQKGNMSALIIPREFVD